MCITQPVCVFVALGTQHATRMRHIVICDRPTLQNMSTLSPKRLHFRGEGELACNAFFEFLYNFCLKYFSDKKN